MHEMNEKSINNLLMQFAPKRENLLKALHELQDNHPQQYLSEEILDKTAKYFNLTKGQLYGIVSYYSMFSLKPRGKYLIRICKSPVCSMMGSRSLFEYIKNACGISEGKTSPDGIFTVEQTECIGRCGKAPSMMINKNVYTELTPQKIDQIINELKTKK